MSCFIVKTYSVTHETVENGNVGHLTGKSLIHLTLDSVDKNGMDLSAAMENRIPICIMDDNTMGWLHPLKDEFKEFLSEKYPEKIIQHGSKFDTVLKT